MLKDKTYYTTEEVAEMFNVKPDTVRQWVKRGVITPINVPNSKSNAEHRFTIEEVTALVNRKYGNV